MSGNQATNTKPSASSNHKRDVAAHLIVVINSDSLDESSISEVRIAVAKLLFYFHFHVDPDFSWSYQISRFSNNMHATKAASRRFLDLSAKSLATLEDALTSTIREGAFATFTAKNTWHLLSELLNKISVPNHLSSPRVKNQCPSVENHVYIISHLPQTKADINVFFNHIVDLDINQENEYSDLKNKMNVSNLLKECIRTNTVASWIDCSLCPNLPLNAMISNVFKNLGGLLLDSKFFHTEHLLHITANITESRFALEKWRHLKLSHASKLCHPLISNTSVLEINLIVSI